VVAEAAGGEGGHGAAKPHGVIHRYIFNTIQRLQVISCLKIMHKTRLHKGRLTANDSSVNVIFTISSANFYI